MVVVVRVPGGDKLRAQKGRVTGCQKHIDDAEADITKKGVTAKSHHKQLEKLAKEMAKDGG